MGECPGQQRRAFVRSEGDAYFRRNAPEPREAERIAADPPLRVLRDLSLSPHRVLEVGSADGWRLAQIAEQAGVSLAAGADPSLTDYDRDTAEERAMGELSEATGELAEQLKRVIERLQTAVREAQ